MARVPILAGNLVQRNPMTDAKLRAADDGGGALGGLGTGMQQLGRAGSQYADAQQEILDRMDDAVIKNADNEAVTRMRGVLHTGDNAYFTKQGFDALNARPIAEKSLADIRVDISGRLKTPRQREMFARIYDQRSGQELEGVARYATGEVRREEERASISRQALSADQAVTLFDDPVRRQENIETGLGEIRSRADKQGWAPEATRAAEVDYRSRIYAAAVQAKMQVDPVAAKQVLDEHRGEISAETEMALDRQLYQPLLERTAVGDVDDLVGGPAAPPEPGQAVPVAPAPSSSVRTIASKIIGVESGGNANARNPMPGQTASGLGQFTDATWLSLYRQKNGGAGMTDAQILALKTDPRIGRQMTELAVREHVRLLRGAGLPATDGNVYLSHFLGPKAIGVLRADPGAPVAGLVPASFVRANPSVLGSKTAGEVIGWADRKMGGQGVRPAREPAKDDLEGLYAAIDRREEWSFDRKQAARAEVERRVARTERVRSVNQERIYGQAKLVAAQLDADFKSVGQIPGFSELEPDKQAHFVSVAKANNRPAPIETDPQTLWALRAMEATRPAQFAKLDIFQYRARLDKAEFEDLVDRQAKAMAPDKTRSPVNIERSRLYSVSREALQAAGVETGDTKEGRKQASRRLRFLDEMAGLASDWKARNPGKQPTDDVIRGWAGNLLLRANGTPVFEADDITVASAIPEQMRNQIIRSLNSQGLPSRPADVAEVWKRAAATNRFTR